MSSLVHSSVAPGSCKACSILSFLCQTLHEVSFGNQYIFLIQFSEPPEMGRIMGKQDDIAGDMRHTEARARLC